MITSLIEYKIRSNGAVGTMEAFGVLSEKEAAAAVRTLTGERRIDITRLEYSDMDNAALRELDEEA